MAHGLEDRQFERTAAAVQCSPSDLGMVRPWTASGPVIAVLALRDRIESCASRPTCLAKLTKQEAVLAAAQVDCIIRDDYPS
jgi:hypothetical protein